MIFDRAKTSGVVHDHRAKVASRERAYRADPAHIPTPHVLRWAKKMGTGMVATMAAMMVVLSSGTFSVDRIEVQTASGRMVMYAGTGGVMMASGAILRTYVP